ncbi:FecR protein [Posidoniimonas polymericola]|uniref:FecR protein n=1 Tax=Posidoniimonas polymericola TaxID=2528002 RepID=A0A5C5YKT2_9BACT|nr:FecR domain-containing protein [Posidoniimonas polymericola]TWT75523.1 FecR protein [Posidoniimonas polymericola]
MPIPPQEIEQLIEILSRSWDGRATGDEVDAIEEFVRRYGSAGVEVLMQASSLHLELQRLVESSRVYDLAMDRVRAAAKLQQFAERSANEAMSELAPARRREQRKFPRSGFVWAAAAALLLAVGMPWWISSQSARPDRPAGGNRLVQQSQLIRPSTPVARVVALEDAAWAEGGDIFVGSYIKKGRKLELTAGQAHLSMVCGADIVLQAPCTVRLSADDEVQLEDGTLTAQAAKWATGFVVITQDLRITDLGTRFAVSTSKSGVVEAHVLQGEILAEPMKHRRPRHSSMLLEKGQAIRVNPFKSSIDLIAARNEDFVGEIVDFRPLRPIPMWNTGVGLMPGDTDPHWRLISGSDPHGPYPRDSVVTVGDTRSYKNNKPEVSQWISVAEEGYPGVPPESVHTFETTFELGGYDLDTVYVVGQILVDDAVNELRINGRPVSFKRWVTTWDEFDFKSFHPIEILEGFVEGTNVISIDVYNSPSNPSTPADFNPTGLRVEWQAFGREHR